MLTTKVSGVTQSNIEEYDRDGVTCVRGVVDQSWLARLAVGVEEVMAGPGGERNGVESAVDEPAFYSFYTVWRRNETFKAFSCEGPTAGIAAQIMHSSKIALYSDHLLVKEPGSTAPTPWHHDLTYWRVRGSQVCSVWVPLDRVTRDSGAVEYVRGSHKWGRYFRPVEFGDDARYQKMGYESVPDIEAHRGEYDIVSYDLDPGDCIVFHALTLHGAPGNQSTRSRRAVSVRWTGDDATYFRDPSLGEAAFPDAPELKDGDPIACDRYPLVWRAGD